MILIQNCKYLFMKAIKKQYFDGKVKKIIAKYALVCNLS